MALNEKIAALRNERKLSQTELAEKLDVSRQSISKWETGASVPELDKLVALSRLFGVTLDELVKDKGVEQPPEQIPVQEQIPPQITYVVQQKNWQVRVALGLLLLVLGILAVGVGVVMMESDNGDLHPLIPIGVIIAAYGGTCLIFRKHPCLTCGWLTTGVLSLTKIFYAPIGLNGFEWNIETIPQILFYLFLPVMSVLTVLTLWRSRK